MAMTIVSVFFPMFVSSSVLGMSENVFYEPPPGPCQDPCKITFVESIPENLTYPSGSPSHPSTYEYWSSLIQGAESHIDIGSFYWTLRGEDIHYEDPSDWQGEDIYKEILKAGTSRKIDIRIAQNQPAPGQPSYDSEDLQKLGAAQVRSLNFTRWFGGGILHTKLIVVDGKHFYVGSANMDWRSLTQVKELGVVVTDCKCLASDVTKIFEVYWLMGKEGAQLPHNWPVDLETQFNMNTPMQLKLNNTDYNAYLASSPPGFCPRGRTSDIESILHVISTAKKFIHIAVMDYFPTTLYTNPRQFWPIIDDALRKASLERGIEVRVMASWWNHSRSDLPKYLQSLADLNGAMKANIETKLFHVPAFTPAQEKIPFGRVNHNKYMVTESTAYIGTSNWSGDYFTSTGGIGFIITPAQHSNSTSADDSSTVPAQLAAIFSRDWNSSYAHPVSDILQHIQKYGHDDENSAQWL